MNAVNFKTIWCKLNWKKELAGRKQIGWWNWTNISVICQMCVTVHIQPWLHVNSCVRCCSCCLAPNAQQKGRRPNAYVRVESVRWFRIVRRMNMAPNSMAYDESHENMCSRRCACAHAISFSNIVLKPNSTSKLHEDVSHGSWRSPSLVCCLQLKGNCSAAQSPPQHKPFDSSANAFTQRRMCWLYTTLGGDVTVSSLVYRWHTTNAIAGTKRQFNALSTVSGEIASNTQRRTQKTINLLQWQFHLLPNATTFLLNKFGIHRIMPLSCWHLLNTHCGKNPILFSTSRCAG